MSPDAAVKGRKGRAGLTTKLQVPEGLATVSGDVTAMCPGGIDAWFKASRRSWRIQVRSGGETMQEIMGNLGMITECRALSNP